MSCGFDCGFCAVFGRRIPNPAFAIDVRFGIIKVFYGICERKIKIKHYKAKSLRTKTQVEPEAFILKAISDY